MELEGQEVLRIPLGSKTDGEGCELRWDIISGVGTARFEGNQKSSALDES